MAGSSTGDLVCGDLTGAVRWRFDNHGYPAHRIRCGDLDGDGRPEVALASGTGYVYLLNQAGQARWARRLGSAVTDLLLERGHLLAGTSDGQVVALDAAGQELWRGELGEGVTCLERLAGRVVAGGEQGRVAAWDLPPA
ncbi:MAG: PQQ-like beta-propeller repeat protein [Fimbriimonadaceae bacterium]|nr:PQQ-like beta-propeller repeat protein [Fimbriimonadaceae bacterium]